MSKFNITSNQTTKENKKIGIKIVEMNVSENKITIDLNHLIEILKNKNVEKEDFVQFIIQAEVEREIRRFLNYKKFKKLIILLDLNKNNLYFLISIINQFKDLVVYKIDLNNSRIFLLKTNKQI